MLTENLVLSEILFAVVYIIAGLVAWEFIKTKDGTLRKIMITYFTVEVFMYLSCAIFFYLKAYNLTNISGDAFRIFFILPKVFVKLWLLWWLKKGRFINLK